MSPGSRICAERVAKGQPKCGFADPLAAFGPLRARYGAQKKAEGLKGSQDSARPEIEGLRKV